MNDTQVIQWFPGHMAKTVRTLSEKLKLVDVVAEIVDARTPKSSRNPLLNELIGNKPRIIILNKIDLADNNRTLDWINFYKKQEIFTLCVDCKSGKGIKLFVPMIKKILNKKIESANAKGIKKTLRVMVVGIPNVGKSSFINRLSRGKKAKVEDRPGVTRGNQWFTIDKNIELLDTPGILWPRIDDASVGEKLAFIGAIKDQIMDTESLACRLIKYLNDNYQSNLIHRYKLENYDTDKKTEKEILSIIAQKRGMLISGGKIDVERAAIMLLDEFREAKLGKITLDSF